MDPIYLITPEIEETEILEPAVISGENAPLKTVASVQIRDLSGELRSPLLGNSNGNVFISPSFTYANTGNEIFVESVETSTNAGDVYKGDKRPPINSRPFVLGPPPAVPSGRVYPPDFSTSPPSYVPAFNQSYTFMGTTENNVSGVLHDTMSMTDTIIFY